MRKSIRRVGVSVGLTGLILVGAGAAYASATNVSVNGVNTVADVPFTATNSGATAFNTNYGVKMECLNSAIDGVVKRGANVAPFDVLASINNLTLTNCTMAGWIPLTVTMDATNIVATATAAAGAPVPARITNIHAEIVSKSSGVPCSFEADGTLDAVITPGSHATLDLVSAAFGTTDTGFDLEISNVVGCGGEVQDGDLAGAWDSIKAVPPATAGTPSSFNVTTTGPLAGVVSHF